MWDKIAWAGDDGFATRLSQDISTALDDKLMRNTRQTHSTSVANIPAKRPKCVCRVRILSTMQVVAVLPSVWIYRGFDGVGVNL